MAAFAYSFVRTADTADGAHRFHYFPPLPRTVTALCIQCLLSDKTAMEFDYVIQLAVFEPVYALLVSRPQVQNRKSALYCKI